MILVSLVTIRIKIYLFEQGIFQRKFEKRNNEFYKAVLKIYQEEIKCSKEAIGKHKCMLVEVKDRGPRLKYVQEQHCTCAIYSLASSLYQISDDLVASYVRSKVVECQRNTYSSTFKFIINLLNNGDKNDFNEYLKVYCCTTLKKSQL